MWNIPTFVQRSVTYKTETYYFVLCTAIPRYVKEDPMYISISKPNHVFSFMSDKFWTQICCITVIELLLFVCFLSRFKVAEKIQLFLII